MSLLLRLARLGMAVAIVVAVAYQFNRSMDVTDLSAVSFFSYFTILSNIFAAVVLTLEAAQPGRMGEPGFIAVRGAATLYMTVTGLVYAVLLAPASADVGLTAPWVDFVVHVLGPIVVFADWMVDPPPARPSRNAALAWMIFPVVYLVYSLVRGPIVDWYPYPFMDPDQGNGYLEVAVYSLGVAVVVAAIGAFVYWWAGRSWAWQVPQRA